MANEKKVTLKVKIKTPHICGRTHRQFLFVMPSLNASTLRIYTGRYETTNNKSKDNDINQQVRKSAVITASGSRLTFGHVNSLTGAIECRSFDISFSISVSTHLSDADVQVVGKWKPVNDNIRFHIEEESNVVAVEVYTERYERVAPGEC
ncbi:hypothetical protein T440DRAFT_482236 [Plenodomus tracheiphilus IPT5]|uniref:Uncharacterized protein n=1 Tax=Plenodomus tracheiphilus IPT5 TaxID=1408161 RepID=A0A6A7AU35_9PLEO|nr:hypothetical protein T440DRAFT_482236 [Plenodomus tracheiphilus IPT5]